jgi:ArsR family transcriptional regulator
MATTSINKRDENPMDTNAFAAICKALGHPARVKIVSHLKAIDQCVCGEIVQILPLAQSTVSQHLKALKNAGLIKGEVEGPRTCYCLDHEVLDQFKRMAEEI